MSTLSALENRARRVRERAAGSNPRTPVGLIERNIALLYSHLEEALSLRERHLGAIALAASKAASDLLMWKERGTGDLQGWLHRGDAIKGRMNQLAAERRHVEAGFALELRSLRERLLIAFNDLDQLRQ